MGHLRGGWDDFAGFNAGGAAAGGGLEGAAGPEGAGGAGGEAAWKVGGWAGACIITGAGAGGWGKASFLRIDHSLFFLIRILLEIIMYYYSQSLRKFSIVALNF